MKVSYKWLQSYFDTPLPAPAELAQQLTFHAFEIEEIVPVGADTMIDVKVTPDRGHDCLSHRGIAKEVSIILNMPLSRDLLRAVAALLEPKTDSLSITLEDPKLCLRYAAAVLTGIKVAPSPKWLIERLEAIGQRSINNVVDITNYVMFDIGQPLHAFDAGKVKEQDGKREISVRRAQEKESVVGLDGKTYETGPLDLLIVDTLADAPLGIAGVKGGRASEIGPETAEIIIESANFDRTSVRKTSQRLKLRTDASVRFENEPSVELVAHGLHEAVRMMQELASGELKGYADVYPDPQEPTKVSVSLSEINGLLGTHMSAADVASILERFGFSAAQSGETFEVSVPFERLDITIKENLIEEIGRIYGYEKIAPAALPKGITAGINKRYYYSDKIRRLLLERGFSEVYTSSFRSDGDVALANALASDKSFLRRDLASNLRATLEQNLKNAPLLGLEQIAIFEIGTAFPVGEVWRLAFGIAGGKKGSAAERLKETAAELSQLLGAEFEATADVIEIDLGAIIEKLPEPTSYEIVEAEPREVSYKPFSIYPFVLRDIALWVPGGVSSDEVVEVLAREGGEALIRTDLFDEFKKEGKVSYAFHLVFQSHEKTLSDDEVNAVMESIVAALGARGWEVR